MTERGITEHDVAEARANVVMRCPGNQPGTVRLEGLVGNRVLKMVVRATDESFVITLMWKD